MASFLQHQGLWMHLWAGPTATVEKVPFIWKMINSRGPLFVSSRKQHHVHRQRIDLLLKIIKQKWHANQKWLMAKQAEWSCSPETRYTATLLPQTQLEPSWKDTFFCVHSPDSPLRFFWFYLYVHIQSSHLPDKAIRIKTSSFIHKNCGNGKWLSNCFW